MQLYVDEHGQIRINNGRKDNVVCAVEEDDGWVREVAHPEVVDDIIKRYNTFEDMESALVYWKAVAETRDVGIEALKSQVERLRAELAEKNTECTKWNSDAVDLAEHGGKLTEQLNVVKALGDRLVGYADHMASCAIVAMDDDTCTCGMYDTVGQYRRLRENDV